MFVKGGYDLTSLGINVPGELRHRLSIYLDGLLDPGGDSGNNLEDTCTVDLGFEDVRVIISMMVICVIILF